jgi:hypothetical protein
VRGLLEGKTVSAYLINDIKSYSVESALKLLLANKQIDFKRTGNNQFSLFEIPLPEIITTEPAVESVTIAGKVTSSKDGSFLAKPPFP